jgi:hypothetical protein
LLVQFLYGGFKPLITGCVIAGHLLALPSIMSQPQYATMQTALIVNAVIM